jgi:hypothetical protein
MNLDEIFMQSYLKEYTEKEKKKIIHSQEERLIAAEKKKKLVVIEEFLQKFVDLDVMVNHRDEYTKNSTSLEGVEPKKFEFYLVDSSKTWSPGISIFFDHPCEVEIAIPNKTEEEGVVVIRVSSHHPDAYILEQKFHTLDAACKSLARFLSKCTVKIGKDPRGYVKEALSKKSNSDFPTSNIPDAPPNSERKVVMQKEKIENNMSLKKIGELFNMNKSKDEE